MIDALKPLIPNFSHFQEHEIVDGLGGIVGYQSTLITSNNVAFAGGTGSNLNHARRVCAAEAIERASFLKASLSDSEKVRLLLTEFPTTCGFAAGFKEETTIYRSVCEAVERWAWSKWIDEGLLLSKVTPNLRTKLSEHFKKQFDEVVFLEIPLKVEGALLPKFVPEDLILSVVLARKGDGVFPGSRVTTASDERWEHPLLEAWRHQLIFENELTNITPKDIFEKRIKHFGLYGQGVIDKVASTESTKFPVAKLRLLSKVAQDGIGAGRSYFVYRALCADFVGWDRGDELRFIY